MKVKMRNIKWSDNDLNMDSDGLPKECVVDVACTPASSEAHIRRACFDKLMARRDAMGCEPVSADMAYPYEDSGMGMPLSEPEKTDTRPGPRMIWIHGEYADTLVNVDRISSIVVYKSDPNRGDGILYTEDNHPPIKVSAEDIRRIEKMCCVVDDDGADGTGRSE